MRASFVNRDYAGAVHPETVPGAEFDARSRMFVTLLASASTIAVSSPDGQAVLFFASFVYALSVRRFRALAVAYAFMALMMLAAAFCSWGVSRALPSMPFSPAGLAVPFMRGAVMLNVVLPLALTCRIQSLLTALKGLRLPFCIYLPGAVMIRFIPTFMNDMKQVAETLKIRGYDLGPKALFLHPLMTLRLVFTPMLFRSLRPSEELGIAAELKGIESGGVFVPFRPSAWTRRDTLLVALALAATAAAFCCHVLWGGPSVSAMH